MNELVEPAKIRLENSCPPPLPDSDLGVSRALLSRAQAGDAPALNELIARYYERLRRIVRIRLGDAARRRLDSGDIVQETFHSALKGLVDLRVSEDGELLRWFARVAENRIRDEIDRQRAQKRSAGGEMRGDASESLGAMAAADSAPPDVAYRNEVREILDQAIAELPDDYREAVVLRDFCGAEWSVIAERLGRANVHAVQQLHQRAWIKLRRSAAERLGALD
ncbi:MAG: sigma-70 family RNA polymerase sigma factor [Planctomycetes bacterium]|nr:sigma-70 family RNA polymerase sigma factor [Planctomycetota bacterium]